MVDSVKKILIVEDEEILAKVLKDRFETEGWDVQVAYDGQEAIDKVGKTVFDLVTLDFLLPKVNGFEVLEYIRSRSELSKLPVVILSNLGEDEDIKRAMKLGATDYFIKTQHPIGEVIEKAEAFLHKNI